MREIKFRGKRADNGEWVCGGFFETEEGPYIVSGFNSFYPVIPETVGQFTGLTDKNGVEIYDGDKIRCRDSDSLHYMNDPYDPDCFVVQYDERHNGFNSFPKWDDENILNKLIDSCGGLITWPNENILACHWHFEVIGNIHEK